MTAIWNSPFSSVRNGLWNRSRAVRRVVLHVRIVLEHEVIEFRRDRPAGRAIDDPPPSQEPAFRSKFLVIGPSSRPSPTR